MSTAAAPLVNGHASPSLQSFNEALEYEKILRLRDEVFAGSHPRLTVPAHALKVVSPRPPQLTPQTNKNISTTFTTPAPTTQVPTLSTQREAVPSPLSFPVSGPTSASNSQPTLSNVSEFDPILLTKSDDLVRAEIQLKRQRLEKALRDQFEQKRLEARKRPAPAEAKPDFDIPTILAKALEVTKPLSFKDDASASDSFDENSFYSSRAPDSTPERGPGSPSPSRDQVPISADDFVVDRHSGPRMQSAVMGAPLDLDANDTSPRLPSSALRADITRNAPELSAAELDDEEEEGEYSPPEAMEQYPTPHDTGLSTSQRSHDPRTRPLRTYSELDDDAKRPMSPSDNNMRTNGRIRRDRGRQQQVASPEPGLQYGPRKKRKIEKRNERKARRNGGLSPDAFIKEENVSPPPFHDVQPLGSARLRSNAPDRPIIIDDGPVQDVRYVPTTDRYMGSPNRLPSQQIDTGMPLSEPRALTRAPMRALRDDQDLRRVASMHNMRTEQPREYIEPIYESPVQPRSTSYRAASPMVQQRAIHEDYDRPVLQEIRVSRTPAPVYREMYEDAEPQPRYQSLASMPPPPPVERIIVDQYGRRFREILQPERSSVAPRAASVRPGGTEAPYETHRNVRSGSAFVEGPIERRYVQDMPPPQPTYRRVAETPQTSAIPLSAARGEFDQSEVSRRMGGQMIERGSRQPIYVDEHGEVREPTRMSSVRASGIRYEEASPRGTIVRGQSVHPVVRDGGMFVDEAAPVRHEYVPVEQARYRVVEPEERYFDSQGREVIAVNGSRHVGQRVLQQY